LRDASSDLLGKEWFDAQTASEDEAESEFTKYMAAQQAEMAMRMARDGGM
jgi:hypothetical protein